MPIKMKHLKQSSGNADINNVHSLLHINPSLIPTNKRITTAFTSLPVEAGASLPPSSALQVYQSLGSPSPPFY